MRTSLKALFIVIFLATGYVAAAQNNSPQDWRSRMRSERIAFLTSEMGLTPEEAQAFWPLYNKAEAEEGRAFEAVMRAFRELDKAVREKKPEAEISRLLHEYTNAVRNSSGIDARYASQYERIISAEKVAKLFLAEEKFRNNQIHRLQRPASAPQHSDQQPQQQSPWGRHQQKQQ